MQVLSRLALLTCFAGCLPIAAADPAKQEHPPANEIIAKAVEWAQWHHEQKFYKRWRLEHVYTARHLNDAEAVQSTETRSFQVYPLAGEQFYELETRDGQPLSRADLRKETKRKREFIEKASKKAAGKISVPDAEDEEEFDFDHELVSRYRAEVIGLEEIAGRPAYVLTFEPKEGPLPVRRRADHALNHSRGKLWIDSKDFVVLQVDFELMEPVRLWGGILGSLSRMHGRLTLTELGGGAWHYKQLDVYVKARVLVKSFHQNMRLEWKDFLPVEISGGL
jgi:hypothetical protein